MEDKKGKNDSKNSKYVFSKVTGEYYDASNVVRLVNVAQIAAYVANNAELLDIYASSDRKTGKPIIVGVFDRSETADLYDKWCRYEL